MAGLLAQVEPPPSAPPFGLVASLVFAAVGMGMVLYIASVLYRESDGDREEDDASGPANSEGE